jgi:hypothetical protein
MLFSLRTWLIVAAAVVAAWWFLFRKRAEAAAPGAPAETITGQPRSAIDTALVPAGPAQQTATQGTQTLPARDAISQYGLIGRPPAPSPLSLNSLLKSAAAYPTGSVFSASGNPPPPPRPLPFTAPNLTPTGVSTNAAQPVAVSWLRPRAPILTGAR